MKYIITDLIVELEAKGELLKSRLAPYEYHGEKEADIVFCVSQQYYKDKNKVYEDLTLDECEYLWSGTFFYEQLSKYNGIMLHSSCVEYKGKAYLFSANSGTGKSTHTHLWLKYLPGSRIINDDKPAIRIIDGKIYAYGTPWSGKTNESVNEGVEIGGICFIARGENKIKRVPGASVIMKFMQQTVRSGNKELISKRLDTLNLILSTVPVYEMTCDMSEEAVKTAYEGMRDS